MNSAPRHSATILHLCVLLALGGCEASDKAPTDDGQDQTYAPIDDGDGDDANPVDDNTGDADETGDEEETGDETGDEGETGDEDDTGDHSSEEPLLTPEECAAMCSERADTIDERAFCPFDMLAGDCPTVCGEYADFELPTQEAFTTCVTDDPLCYIDIHDCVAWVRYPGATLARLNLTATGFDADAGMTVVLGLQEASSDFSMVTSEVTADGGFAASWSEEVNAHRSSQLVLYYVDQNGNGTCDPGVDRTGSAHLERGENIDDLFFSARIEPLGYDADFVCDFI
jgi:hypothetical protein